MKPIMILVLAMSGCATDPTATTAEQAAEVDPGRHVEARIRLDRPSAEGVLDAAIALGFLTREANPFDASCVPDLPEATIKCCVFTPGGNCCATCNINGQDCLLVCVLH